ncbi:hypothetical protein HMPREF1246_0258 [Acidaminococcus sp. BV3L6]|nr:hypothetical protein HMPREF1246_0258 [Acidaminococcus sp. BV3L6]
MKAFLSAWGETFFFHCIRQRFILQGKRGGTSNKTFWRG